MAKEKFIKYYFPILMVMVIIFAGIEIAVASTTIKVALITPDGSPWTDTLRKMTNEVEKKTDGEIKFKIYAGGVSGDEVDVLRKMQVNRIHAAGFSGVGLGIILPMIRILEAPLLYNNCKEIDLVKEKLYDEFAAGFEKKGYILLGFAEAGFVYFFSKKKMSGPDGLKDIKMWVWKSDPVAKTSLETFGIRTYPLHQADVNTGLETGMIDSFYSPPLAAIYFQWHSKIQYFLDYPMVNSTGALLLKKKQFDKISKKNQIILKMTAEKYCRELVYNTRKGNKEAHAVLEKMGVIIEPPLKKQIVSFKEDAKEIYEKSIPQLYSMKLFNKVQDILKAYRNTQLPSK